MLANGLNGKKYNIMSSVQDELNNIGKKITADAKKNALPNKKTGALDKSFKYESSFISNDNFQLVINQKYYGVYLNSGNGRGFEGTHYMDRAIASNLPKGIDSIVNIIVGEILNPITQKNK